jgi:cystathionine beta-lyase
MSKELAWKGCPRQDLRPWKGETMFDFTTLTPPTNVSVPLWSRKNPDAFGKPDAVDLGVAEMKFPLCPAVEEALFRQVKQGAFGYPYGDEAYFSAVRTWMEMRHSWKVEQEWITPTYGLVSAIGYCVRALTEPEDGVLVCFPSYGPFPRAVRQNGRTLVESALVLDNGRYVLDLEDIEEKLRRPEVKLLIFCNPHNPTGRVWTREELMAVGNLCCKYDVPIVSDEIHFDLVYQPGSHHVLASLSPEIASRTVTLTAPSKTFNLAGLTIGNVIVSDPDLRTRVWNVITREMGGYHNLLSLTACQAAYEGGGPWYEALLKVLRENLELLCRELNEMIPGMQLVPPEGTYLLWGDFSGMGLSGKALTEFLHGAGFFSQQGTDFGAAYPTFQRVNAACPEKYLHIALERLRKALGAK